MVCVKLTLTLLLRLPSNNWKKKKRCHKLKKKQCSVPGVFNLQNALMQKCEAHRVEKCKKVSNIKAARKILQGTVRHARMQWPSPAEAIFKLKLHQSWTALQMRICFASGRKCFFTPSLALNGSEWEENFDFTQVRPPLYSHWKQLQNAKTRALHSNFRSNLNSAGATGCWMSITNYVF